METFPLLAIVVSVGESCIPGTKNPIVAMILQCAESPGLMLKQMLVRGGT